ncbi:putative MFS family arabinose efflux permease [Rhodoblastus sphagnicola]|nr:putative MFS family arabinose efflux permease [Rhodoblastus sphagnicola]
MLCQTGSFISFILLGSANTIALLFLAQVVNGFTAGNMAVAAALATDRAPPHLYRHALGALSAAIGVGVMIGPALSAALAGLSATAPIWAAVALSGLTLIASALLLPADHGRADSAAVVAKEPAPRWSVLREVAWPLAASAFFHLSFTMFMAQFALFAASQLTWRSHAFGLQEVGSVFAVMGAISIYVQLLGMRQAERVLDPELIPLLGLAVLGAGFLMFCSVGPITVALGVLMVSFGSSISRPYLLDYIARAAHSSGRGQALGLNSAAMAGANMIGPLAAGYLIAQERFALWGVAMAASAILSLSLVCLSRASRSGGSILGHEDA